IQIRKHKLLALDTLADRYRDIYTQHWACIYKRVKLAFLTTRIDSVGQGSQQVLIKLASDKRSVEFLRVNTGQLCPHTRRDHPLSQVPSGLPPQWKYRLQTSVSHLFFTIRAHIFEKQVAKCDPFDSSGDRSAHVWAISDSYCSLEQGQGK